jgi:hypothetical protein
MPVEGWLLRMCELVAVQIKNNTERFETAARPCKTDWIVCLGSAVVRITNSALLCVVGSLWVCCVASQIALALAFKHTGKRVLGLAVLTVDSHAER